MKPNCSDPRFPDFYIVGAAKSGTTSLFHYLRQHPSIFFPWVKELHYFADRSLPHGGRFRERESYLRMYESCPPGVLAGDASTSYLPSPTAALRIRSARPDARIIAVLRDPVDRAYSNYWNKRATLQEELSFEDALDDEPRRDQSGLTHGFLYVQTGLYYEQVKRFADAFGERFRVYLFDDLRSDAGALCRDILSFLDVDPDWSLDTSVVYYPSGLVRSRILGRLMVRPFPGRRWLVQRWGPHLRDLKGAVWRRNVRRPPPMNPVTRLRLIEIFRPDVERLGGFLGRDLSAWLDPRPGG